MEWLIFAMICAIVGVQGTGPTHGHRVICYLDYWSLYNDVLDIGEVEPALDKCTHFIVMFADVDKTYHVTSRSPVREVDLGGYDRSVAVRKKFPHLKVMISVGGSRVESRIWSEMCASKKTRKEFVESSVQFLRRHSFDGMEIRWYYPGISGGSSEDGKNLVLLAKELRREFDKNGLIFTIALPKGKRTIDAGADVREISQYTDFINILAMEYHDYNEGRVNVGTPLFSKDELSVNWTINYYLKMGVDPSKMNLGLSGYLATYVTKNPITQGNNIVGLRVTSGFPGERTRSKGSIAYFEICEELQSNPNDWKIIKDDQTKTPLAVETNKNRIISMENEETFALKVKYALEKKLGGVHFFGLDKDDFTQLCKSSKVKYPLLSSIDRTMHEQSRIFYDNILSRNKLFNSHYFWTGLKE